MPPEKAEEKPEEKPEKTEERVMKKVKRETEKDRVARQLSHLAECPEEEEILEEQDELEQCA